MTTTHAPIPLLTLLALLCSGCGSQIVTEWHEDGKTKYSEGQAETDDPNSRYGLWTFWYENGNRWMEGAYESGKREGIWTFWYENGAVSQVGPFEKGDRNGPFTYWYRNGMKSQEVTFVNGQRHGLEITWYENNLGLRSRERQFDHGKQVGFEVTRDSSGSVVSTRKIAQ
ncbi:MAG: hypothetical protein MK209_06770 [Planctomycetes bacterium]|nr:hypothetical protein [Planctomycetota bacterium]